MTHLLQAEVLLTVGPVPLTRAVLTTWIIMAVLVLGSALCTRRLRTREVSPRQGALELLVTVMNRQIEDVMRQPPAPFLPLLGALFVYLVAANLCSLLPGVSSPTGHLETPAALAAIVFVAVRWYGIRMSGLWGHLKSFAQPSVFAVPLNIIGEITRTLALTVRLFGNVMSGQLLVAVVIMLAGLLLPLPLMALTLVTGIIQAYIFTILAAVFIAAGVSAMKTEEKPS